MGLAHALNYSVENIQNDVRQKILYEKSQFDSLVWGSLTLAPIIFTVSVWAGGRAYSNARFGTGSGPIFLDDVQCTSSSSKLLECPSRPILSHNCLHSADAGVGCEGMCNLRLILCCTMQLVTSCIQLLAQLVSCD